jgi:[FeFe] hydrogenase H-cluster maturation GTPase HydF
MLKTPKGLRLHIGVFGRRNVGKSSLLNALVGQDVSIVSDVAGTTTDVVEKVMELKPIGPVVFLDTAGIDDVGALGKARIEKTDQVIERCELAILVTDKWQDYEKRLIKRFRQRKTPFLIAANKDDQRTNSQLEAKIADMIAEDLAQDPKNDAADNTNQKTAKTTAIVATSATTRKGIDLLRKAVIDSAPPEYLKSSTIIGDIIPQGSCIILVTPIDLEAPKGRLILPQVQTLRDILDADSYSLVVKENHLADALKNLAADPALVITDSQAFEQVSQIVPENINLTGFSIVFARFKGDLLELVKGVKAIENLKPNDKILIAEACSHHPIEGDIGRQKIPNWLRKHLGFDLDIDVKAGRDVPENVSKYKLVIHCGACVFNRKEMLSRIENAIICETPITNYGVTIAYLHGMLKRALQPFTKKIPELKNIIK